MTNAVLQDTETTAKLVGSPTGADTFRVHEPDIEETDVSMLHSTPLTRTSPSRKSPSPSRASRMRAVSPTRGRSPAVAESTVSAVQSALKKRQLQVQELKNKMTAAKDEAVATRKQVKDLKGEKRNLEDTVGKLKNHLDET